MANLKNTIINGEIFQIPAGTTSSRPSTPVTGELRFNTDENKIEIYTGSVWNQIEEATENIYVFQCQLNNISVDSNGFAQESIIGSTEINIGGFSSSSTSIIVPQTGIYRVYSNIHYQNNSGAREAIAISFSKNGTRLGPVGAAVYTRVSSALNSGRLDEFTSVNLENLIECNAGDTIGLQTKEKASYGGPVGPIQGSNSLLHIEYIGI